jgi:hypothetical protein
MHGHVYVKPAAGLVVLDPLTAKPLPAEGAWVADATYWHRRLADGDVVLAAEPPQTPPEAPLKAQAKTPQPRSMK